MVDVTIIGAGVAGLCAAYELASRGFSLRIIDRKGAPGPHGCSWWAGGMLAPFCEAATAEPVIARLGAESESWWNKVTHVTQNGTLVVALARDRTELQHFGQRTEGHRWLDSAELSAIEPELSHCRYGLFFEREAHLTPRSALSDLVALLAQKGIVIEQAEIEPKDIAGTVIDARGFAAADQLKTLRGVRGEMVHLHAPDIHIARPIRLLHPRHPLYIVPRGDGYYMLGATQIESSERRPVTARSMLELLSAAYALDPRFAEASIIETAADLRPAFPDNVPRVTAKGRVFHVNGLFRHGYLFAPLLARTLADFLQHGTKGELFHED